MRYLFFIVFLAGCSAKDMSVNDQFFYERQQWQRDCQKHLQQRTKVLGPRAIRVHCIYPSFKHYPVI